MGPLLDPLVVRQITEAVAAANGRTQWLTFVTGIVGGLIGAVSTLVVTGIKARLDAKSAHRVRLLEAYADVAGTVHQIDQAILYYKVARVEERNNSARLKATSDTVMNALTPFKLAKATVELQENSKECLDALRRLNNAISKRTVNLLKFPEGLAGDEATKAIMKFQETDQALDVDVDHAQGDMVAIVRSKYPV